MTRLAVTHDHPGSLTMQSGLSRDDWRSEYARYHDDVVARQASTHQLKAVIKAAASAAANNWNYKNVAYGLAYKIGILDLEGWKSLCRSWQTGLWPEAAAGAAHETRASAPIPKPVPSEISSGPSMKLSTGSSTEEIVKIFRHYAPMVEAGMSMTELGKMLQSQVSSLRLDLLLRLRLRLHLDLRLRRP